jgi:hypothetical protein
VKHWITGWGAVLGAYLIGVSLIGYSVGLFSCSAAQHPTVEQARAGLRLACDALAVATVQGTDVPAHELAALACDDERTSAVMRQLLERAKLARQLVTVPPPEWLDDDRTDAGLPRVGN